MKLVDITIDIAAAADIVFDLLSTADGLCAWMAADAEVDLRPDGSWRWVHDDGNACSGTYLVIDRPHRLTFTYGWESGEFDDVRPGSTHVDVALVPIGDGTRLTLRHSDLPGDRAERHQHGWAHFLGLLARVASGDDVVTKTGGS